MFIQMTNLTDDQMAAVRREMDMRNYKLGIDFEYEMSVRGENGMRKPIGFGFAGAEAATVASHALYVVR